MTRRLSAPFLLTAALLLSGVCRPAIGRAAATESGDNPAIVAVFRTPDPGYGWENRHLAVLAANKVIRPKVIMMGDSITHLWGGEPAYKDRNGADSWDALFKNLPVVNAGFGSDLTQHLLWRIEHGELDGVKPERVVLLIGTNNLPGPGDRSFATSPAGITAGVRACVDAVRKKLPETKILVLGLLPRADRADAWLPAIRETNKNISTAATAAKVDYLDPYDLFVGPDGKTRQTLFSDGVHPNAEGYRILAKAIAPFLPTPVAGH